jgi:hypothetical protein
MTSECDKIIGRAKTTLVFGAHEDATAVVGTILARVSETTPTRVTARGTVKFDAGLLEHVERQIIPMIDRIARALLPHYEPRCVELSAVNLAAASWWDRGIEIAGFSADAAIFLVILSAVLGVPLPQDIVVTGHLSSDQGDINAVRNLAKKLSAAASDSSVRRFLLPSLKTDHSLQRLAPSEEDQAIEAVIRARRDFCVVEVADVAQLVREVVDEESVILASLKSSFFQQPERHAGASAPIDQIIHFLTADLEPRFWRLIETLLFQSERDRLHLLLDSRIRYELTRGHYPTEFGRKLHRIMRSLPPALRRKEGLFPLLPADLCLALCRLGNSEDLDDIHEFLQACAGKSRSAERGSIASDAVPPADADRRVAAVLEEISADSLAAKIGRPVDTARAVFPLDNILCASCEEFWETATAFYVTVLRHTGSEFASTDSPVIQAECRGLVERTFAREGGAAAALQEARYGVHGGLSFILNQLTLQFKKEREQDYVMLVLAEAFDAQDWPAAVRFMEALIKHIRPYLSADIALDSPAQLVPRCDEILLSYVRSRDRMTQLVRSL